MQEVDRDNDGAISYMEFYKCMQDVLSKDITVTNMVQVKNKQGGKSHRVAQE